jgi:hypothetical protein
MIAHSKMSDIIKELALLCFRETHKVPSSEAVHAALLMAHVAWNRSLGHDIPDYMKLLQIFLRSNPNLWSELRSHDTEVLIETIQKAKEKSHLADRRAVVVCGMREGNVRVEWCEEKDYPEASKLAKKRLDSEYGTGRTIGKRRSRKGS